MAATPDAVLGFSRASKSKGDLLECLASRRGAAAAAVTAATAAAATAAAGAAAVAAAALYTM